MKLLTNAALVALLAGSIGIAGLVPSYAAPGGVSDMSAQSGQHRHMGQHHRGFRGQRAAGLAATLMRMGCTDRSAEALEIAFVRAKYELKLNATQEPLLDTLRTSALADQTSFATTCKTTFGAGGAAATSRTLPDRLEAGLDLGKARVAALEDIVPKFKAFYDSLSPQQQAQLNAHAGWRGKGQSGMDRTGGPGAAPSDDTTQPDSATPAAPSAT